MQMRWVDIPTESVIVGGDGYEWRVTTGPAAAPAGKPRGSIEVTISREGREPFTGWPPAGAMVTVVSMPEVTEHAAMTLLRSALGAELVSCAWCDGDDTAECVCDVNCGKLGCVNF